MVGAHRVVRPTPQLLQWPQPTDDFHGTVTCRPLRFRQALYSSMRLAGIDAHLAEPRVNDCVVIRDEEPLAS